jgi:hypothetical protein
MVHDPTEKLLKAKKEDFKRKLRDTYLSELILSKGYRIMMQQISSRHGSDVEVYSSFDDFDISDQVDLVLSVSPYGFPVISGKVHDALRIGGYVLLLGNSNNKYIHFEDGVDVSLHSKYRKITRSAVKSGVEDCGLELYSIADRIRERYPSYTTGGSIGTPVTSAYAFQKIGN